MGAERGVQKFVLPHAGAWRLKRGVRETKNAEEIIFTRDDGRKNELTAARMQSPPFFFQPI